MSVRLQVLLDSAELAEIRAVAKRHRMTVAEWVRQALRTARKEEPATDSHRKLRIVREAVRGEFPSPDIGQMLTEIEQAYAADGS